MQSVYIKSAVPFTVNPLVKPQGLINFMVHNHPGSNRERVEIEIINPLNLL